MSVPSVSMASAATHLVPPGKPAEFQDPLAILNAISDGLSPSWWLNEVFAATIGFNPIQEVTQWVIGDWESFARCAKAYESLGKCLNSVGDSLKGGLGTLDSGWQGNAADAAHVYFQDLAKAIGDKQQDLQELHDEYMKAARGIWEFAKGAGDLIKEILDMAIIAAVEIAAGAALSWTGVGMAIAWALAALECVAIVKAWASVVGLINKTQMIVYMAHGFGMRVAGTLGNPTSIPFPETTYSHPAVK